MKKIHKLNLKKHRAKKGREACGDEEWKGYVGNGFIYYLWEQGWKANVNLWNRLEKGRNIKGCPLSTEPMQ